MNLVNIVRAFLSHFKIVTESNSQQKVFVLSRARSRNANDVVFAPRKHRLVTLQQNMLTRESKRNKRQRKMRWLARSQLHWINEGIPSTVLRSLPKPNQSGWFQSAKWLLQGIKKSWLPAMFAKWLHFHCVAGWEENPSVFMGHPQVWWFVSIVTVEIRRLQCSASYCKGTASYLFYLVILQLWGQKYKNDLPIAVWKWGFGIQKDHTADKTQNQN